ncbi:hypothetical protein RJT34_18033 [Clitoria ternatea]|uniref:Uncharacterized protein n=1 Tax=Clitoria ternatea TaxID=43366 RepID=A0AAN9PF15_CLITE
MIECCNSCNVSRMMCLFSLGFRDHALECNLTPNGLDKIAKVEENRDRPKLSHIRISRCNFTSGANSGVFKNTSAVYFSSFLFHTTFPYASSSASGSKGWAT